MKHCQRLSLLLAVVGIMSVVMMPMAAVGDDNPITATYSFERPDIVSVQHGADSYSRIVMKDVPNCGNVGQPALPAIGARILIPYGHEVANIDVVAGNRINLGGGFSVEPVAPQGKLGLPNQQVEYAAP